MYPVLLMTKAAFFGNGNRDTAGGTRISGRDLYPIDDGSSGLGSCAI